MNDEWKKIETYQCENNIPYWYGSGVGRGVTICTGLEIDFKYQ